MFNETAAAKHLMKMDAIIREWADEDEITTWLLFGVPDGTESWQELLPLEEEDYNDMMRVGKKILSRIISPLDDGW